MKYKLTNLRQRILKAVIFGISIPLVFGLSLFFAGSPAKALATAGVPQVISYQGRLTDSSGTLLGSASGTTYYFKFSIYDAVSGGTKLWPSSAPASTSASVVSGVFNVGIGDTGNGYPDTLDFNFEDSDSAYLQVEVASTSAGTYETISPRQRITASGYAINSKTLRGFVPSQVASGSNVPVLSSGNLTLGGTNPQINATSSNDLVIQGGAGTGDLVLVTNGGRVGIGTEPLSTDLISASTTYTHSSGNRQGIGNYITVRPGASGTHGTDGLWNAVTTDGASNITSWGYARGSYDSVAHGGTGTLANAYAMGGEVSNWYEGTITDAYGLDLNVFNYATGTISNARLINLGASKFDTGAISNLYGLYINDLSDGDTSYGVYQAGSSDKNYFAGNVGIGTIAPSSTLHVVGTSRFTATSTFLGNVGIGTSTPAHKLYVSDSGAARIGINAGATNGDSALVLSQVGVDKAYVEYIGTTFGGARQNTLEFYTVAGVDQTFLTGGTEKMRILSSNGNVGIGTAVPSSTLHVAGDSRFTATSTFAGNVGIGTSTPATLFAVATSTNIFNVTSGGSVGLNTATPQGTGTNKFEVAGRGAGAAGDYGSIAMSNPSNSGNNYLGALDYYAQGNLISSVRGQVMGGGVSGDLVFFGANSGGTLGEQARILGSGGMQIGLVNGTQGGTLSLYNTAAGTLKNGISLANQATTAGSDIDIAFKAFNASTYASIRGVYAGSDTGSLAFYTASSTSNTEKLRITSTGNIGIGTTAPSTTLHVVGTMRTSATTTIATEGGRVGIRTANPTEEIHLAGGVLVGPSASNEARLTIDNSSGANHNHLIQNTGGSQDAIWMLQRNGVTKWSLGLGYSSSDDFNIGTTENGTNVMVLQGATGNVGIGTSTPSGNLHVTDPDGDVTIKWTNGGNWSGSIVNSTVTNFNPTRDFLFIDDADGYTEHAGIVGIGTGGVGGPAAKLHVVGTTEQLRLGYNGSNYTSLTVGSTGNLTVNASGTNANIGLLPSGTGGVGIGTTAPSSTLHVIGNVQASGTLTLNSGLDTITADPGAGSLTLFNSGDTSATITASGGQTTLSTSGLAANSYLAVGTATANQQTMFYVNGGRAFVGPALGSGVVSNFIGGTSTDVGSSGVVAGVSANSFGQPTFAASNATTYTNAATLYIANAPATGSNVTITNPYALYVAAGDSYFSGNVGIGTASPSSTLHVVGTLTVSATTTIQGRLVDASGNAYSTSSGSAAISTSSAITAFNFPYWSSTTGKLSGTSTLFFASTTGNIAVGTSTASSLFSVATSSIIFNVNANNTVGIGTSTPTTAGLTIVPKSSTQGGMLIRAVSSQSSNLFDIQGPTGIGYAAFSALGYLGVGTTTVNSITHFVTPDTTPIIKLERTGTNAGGFSVLITEADSNSYGSLYWGGLTATSDFVIRDYLGANHLYVDTSTGRVGVGTGITSQNTLANTFTVIDANPNLAISNTNTGGKLYKLRVGTSASSTFDIYDNNSTTVRLAIDGTGKVGIGTASPSTTLHVVGDFTVTATSTFAGNLMPATSTTYDLGSTSLLWKSLHVASSSIVVHADTSNTLKYTLDFTGTTARIVSDAATPIRITTGANTGLNIDTSGNVGIGVNGGGAKLDVAGSLRVAGNLTVDNTVVDTSTRAGNLMNAAPCPGPTFTGNAIAILPSGAFIPTTNDIFYNSTRGLHSRITTVTICAGGEVDLALTDAIAGQVQTDTWTTYTPSATLGSATSGFFGNVYAINYLGLASTLAGGFDVAEQYPTNDASIEAGDVVTMDSSEPLFIKKAETGYDSRLVGVISTNPALTFGNNKSDNWRKVALTGRVPVKISFENGDIAQGDYLTSSATKPGYAMKMTESGVALGMALESASGETEAVMMMVRTGYQHVGPVTGPMSLPLQGQFVAGAQVSVFERIDARVARFGIDALGQAEILPGDTSVEVVFSQPYEHKPIVTVTPTTLANIRYAVTETTLSGFTIEINAKQDEAIGFNWHAFESAPDAKLTVSDGSTRLVNITVTEDPQPEGAPESEPVPGPEVVDGSPVEPDVPQDESIIDSDSAPIEEGVPEPVTEEAPVPEPEIVVVPSEPDAVPAGDPAPDSGGAGDAGAL